MSSSQPRPSQSERSLQMQQRLIQAAIDALVALGYAGTTAVEVCRRAEVTRGAFNHHYSSLHELMAQVLSELYERFAEDFDMQSRTLESLLSGALATSRRPEFKAMVELWLAARNNFELGLHLQPIIESRSAMFDPGSGADTPLGESALATYHLCFEAIIGLAIGQSVSPDGAGPKHRDAVEAQMLALARAADNNAT